MDEILQKLNKAGVRYLLIGGHAMRLRGMPRYTQDWDLFIPPRDLRNFETLNAVLADELEEPVEPLGSRGEGFVQTHNTASGIIQFHLLVPGVPDFAEAEARGVARTTDGGVSVRCLSGPDLLAAKEAANRGSDQRDLIFLREQQTRGLLDD